MPPCKPTLYAPQDPSRGSSVGPRRREGSVSLQTPLSPQLWAWQPQNYHFKEPQKQGEGTKTHLATTAGVFGEGGPACELRGLHFLPHSCASAPVKTLLHRAGGKGVPPAHASTTPALQSSMEGRWNHLKSTLAGNLYSGSLRCSDLEHPCLILHHPWVKFLHD